MKATVIVDNIGNIYPGEWGLCIYIENNGKNILLDAGSSNLFIDNAKKLNLNLQAVDYGVLSHAHYDHANGIPAFLDLNKNAMFNVPLHQIVIQERNYSAITLVYQKGC